MSSSEPLDLTYLVADNFLLVNDDILNFTLLGSTIISTELSYVTNISIPESLRASVIRYTGTPGGDGVALQLNIYAGGLRDMGYNPSIEIINISLLEIGDTTPPTVLDAKLDLTKGLLTLNMSETVDTTVGGYLSGQYSYSPYPINFDRMFLSNSNATHDINVSLVGATISNVSSTILEFKLTEVQRAKLIQMSGTPGGDGVATVLNLNEGAFHDLSVNDVVQTYGIPVREIPDTSPPGVSDVKFDFGTSILTVTSNETLSTRPENQNFGSAFIRNVSLFVNDTDNNQVSLAGSVVIKAELDIFAVRLPEESRVKLLYFSSQPIGDGTPLVIDIAAGSFKDLAGNDLVETFGLVISEVPDTINPTLISSATLQYGTGLLRLSMSETIDLTPLDLINMTRLFFSNSTGDKAHSLSGAKITGVDAQTLIIQLTELQRVTALASSGTQGGDGHALTLDINAGALVDLSSNVIEEVVGHPILETSDTIKPTISNVSFNYSDGIMLIHASETIDLTPASKLDLQHVGITNETDGASPRITLLGATVVEIDGLTVTLHMSENDRANAYYVSGLSGGDGGAAFLRSDPGFLVDIAQNTFDSTTFHTIEEHEDILHPLLLNAILNLSTGELLLNFSETIDFTPLSQIDRRRINVSDSQNSVNTFSLDVAKIDSEDTVVAKFRLPEKFRNAVQRFAGTPGGDGSPSVLDIQSNAVFDLASNDLAEQVFSIVEIPDTVPPVLESATINYTNGKMELSFSETVSSVGNNLNLTKFFLSNYEPVIYELFGLQFQRYADGSTDATDSNQPPAYPGYDPYVLDWSAIRRENTLGIKFIQTVEFVATAFQALMFNCQAFGTSDLCRPYRTLYLSHQENM